MIEGRIYTLFREGREGPEFLTDIPARSLQEAQLKAKTRFNEGKLFLVDKSTIKRTNIL